MAEIKWVKLTTDMFDNRKIKHLRKLPEGNNIVLIWVMLLTMAGRCNAGGMIFLTENIPYTHQMLADELGFEDSTVMLALQALENLNMIVSDEGFFAIAGWEEYQNTEGMEKIREQNRLRKQKQRDSQRLLSPMSRDVTRDVTGHVTGCHATEEEKEERKEEEIKYIGRYKRKPFVPPTLEEVTAYCESRRSTVDPKTFYEYFSASDWYDSKGQKVKSWKQKVITWESHGKDRKTVGANGIPINNAPSDLDGLF